MNDRFTFAWPDEADEDTAADHPTAERVVFPDGIVAAIMYDEHAEDVSPRDDDNLGTMYVYHPGYNLGDEQLSQGSLPEVVCPECGGEGWKTTGTAVEPGREDCGRCDGMGEIEPNLSEWTDAIGALAIMPLFVYEHGGITISSGEFIWLDGGESVTPANTNPRGRNPFDSAGWDTSFSGFIVATREQIDLLGAPDDRENIERALEGEVETYASYLEGEVYWWLVESADGVFSESCSGYVGEIDYCRSAAYTEGVEPIREQVAAEARERAEMAARDIETVGA